MLSIGEKITQLRKAQSWSQEELAQKINSSRVMIGKYEREDNAPSLEVLLKLSDVFNVSVDYLIGKGQFANFDKKMLNRLEELEKLSSEEKQDIFKYIDLVIRDSKTRQAYE